jgi:hypothetical protein
VALQIECGDRGRKSLCVHTLALGKYFLGETVYITQQPDLTEFIIKLPGRRRRG